MLQAVEINNSHRSINLIINLNSKIKRMRNQKNLMMMKNQLKKNRKKKSKTSKPIKSLFNNRPHGQSSRKKKLNLQQQYNRACKKNRNVKKKIYRRIKRFRYSKRKRRTLCYNKILWLRLRANWIQARDKWRNTSKVWLRQKEFNLQKRLS